MDNLHSFAFDIENYKATTRNVPMPTHNQKPLRVYLTLTWNTKVNFFAETKNTKSASSKKAMAMEALDSAGNGTATMSAYQIFGPTKSMQKNTYVSIQNINMIKQNQVRWWPQMLRKCLVTWY